MDKLRRCLLFASLLLAGQYLLAQPLTPADRRLMSKQEDTLKRFADSLVNGQSAAVRFRADSNFVRGLVRSLKTRNSFNYPFDSLLTVSHLYAPDSSFRIFTWELKKDDYVLLQKGAIQLHTRDGSLKLFPLFDYSMFTGKPLDSVRTPANWIGAIYYKIIEKEFRGKKYYTLLGFDDFSISSTKKWLEVLSFDQNQQPVFGGPMISFKNDTLQKPVQARFNTEYKKEAASVMNYDSSLDMIVFDHLISESDEPEKKNTYVPDGTYEGFKWQNGQWVHVDQVFGLTLQDGQFPMDNMIRDEQGNIDERKLEEASEKNMEKARKKKK